MNVFLLPWAISSLWYGLALQQTRLGKPAPLRASLSASLLLTTLFIVVVTELLSRVALLNERSLTVAWSLLAGCSTGWAVVQRRKGGSVVRLRWVSLSRFERQLLTATATLASLTLVTALLYPPNNFDSLTYHMGRIGHWLQQHSIRPFATHIERQIYQPPLAEWIILHTMILGHQDTWANVVQWTAGLGCLIGLSLLAKQLGASRTVQLATMFVAASLPMVILQSSSTQNDLVVSFYLIMLAVYLLRYYQRREISAIAWAGLALGFAFLTKGTAYLFSAPVLLTWGALEVTRLLQREKRTKAIFWLSVRLIPPALLLSGLGIGLNAGHYARNMSVYSHPLTDSQTQGAYTNQTHSAGMMVSNVSRNLAIHFSFPGFHWLAQHGVEQLHNGLGLDVVATDTTYPGSTFDLPMLGNNEDNASNFVHILWLAACVVWLVRARFPNRTAYVLLMSLAGVTFLLFCGYLRWQPWHSRLHTYIFLITSPLMALVLVKAVNAKNRWVFWVLTASGACFALTNPFRPLLTIPPLTQPVSFLNGRAGNYYVNGREFRNVNNGITSMLNKQSRDSLRVGLILGEDDFDYVWYQQLASTTLLYHIRVNTPSRILDSHPAVDYIVSAQNWGDTLHYHNRIYWRMQPEVGRVAVFGPH